MLGRVLVRELVHDVAPVAVGVVDLDERLPLVGERVLREDRLDRALRLARAAVDALLRVDHEDPVGLVDAVDRADVDAGAVFDVDAGLGDDVRHGPNSSEAQPRRQLVDELPPTRSTSADFATHLVEPGGVGGPETRRVGVVRVAEDRDVRLGVGDLGRVDPGDVHDHEVRRVDVIDRDQVMAGQQRLELAPEEEVDPTQQDRRHGRHGNTAASS